MSQKRLQRWRDGFGKRRDAPPGGWPHFLAPLPSRQEWFGRYALYLRSWAWEQRRQGALRRAEYRCRTCPAVQRLHVHHVTYVRVGMEQIEDLRVLCSACHLAIHVSGNTSIPMDANTRAEARLRQQQRGQKAPGFTQDLKTRRRPAAR